MAEMSEIYLREVVVLKVVNQLEKSLDIPISTAQDLAATAFARLWDKDPIVEKNIASLLYMQSVFIHRDEGRRRQRISKIVAGFDADQLSDMLRQDPREDLLEKEDVRNRAETAVAKATTETKSDLEKAFLEVLLTEDNVIDAKSRWHLKIGRVVSALALRGFNVTRRDVDNLRERFKRNPEFRAVRPECAGRHRQPAQCKTHTRR